MPEEFGTNRASYTQNGSVYILTYLMPYGSQRTSRSLSTIMFPVVCIRSMGQPGPLHKGFKLNILQMVDILL